MKYFLAGIILLTAQVAGAWEINQNFCNTLMGLVYHVPDSFRSLRGTQDLQSPYPSYYCRHRVTGVAIAYIRRTEGEWRYEGIIHNDVSAQNIGVWYKEYAAHLAECVPNAGYKLTSKPNADKELKEYPDLVYRHTRAAIAITLKVTNERGSYRLAVLMTK